MNLIDKLPFLTWDIEDVESFNITNEVYADYDFIITEDSDVCLYVGETDYPKMCLRDLLFLSENWENTKINKDQSYSRTNNDVYFLLDIPDYNTLLFLDELVQKSKRVSKNQYQNTVLWKTEITVENYPCEIALYLYGSTAESGSWTNGLPF